jgi:hypothetical protein
MGPFAPTPVHALTESDYERWPVWRFGLDENEEQLDESTAVPYAEAPQRGMHGSFMVKARYALANGGEAWGSVQVDVLGRGLFCTPAFLYISGMPLDPLAADVATRIKRIAKRDMGRPTSWTLAVTIAGEAKPRSGRIRKSRFIQVIGLVARLVALRLFYRTRA